MKPTVSIVTPSYNQQPFLEQTIQSVLAQGDDVHEYFVYDGGSTDGSEATLKKYGTRLTYWESARDGGQSDAIHKGFTRATGDFLFWLNSDDLLLPGAVARIRNLLANDPRVDLVSSYCADVDADSRILYLKRAHAASRTWGHWGVIPIYQPACYFRRSLYLDVGGLDQSLHYAMDTDLWIRLFEAGARSSHIPEFLSAFRHHAASKNGVRPPQYDVELSLLAQKYPAYFNRPLKHATGRMASRALRIVNGSFFLHLWQSRRHHQESVGSVFLPER